MNRLNKIREILNNPNKDLGRIACKFMKTETLLHLAEVREAMGNGNIYAEDIQEPFRTDIIESFKRAENEI